MPKKKAARKPASRKKAPKTPPAAVEPQTESQPRGRPSVYTLELAREFCARIASGRYLHRVAEDEDMPSDTTLYRWLDDNLEFRGMYVRAREIRAERDAEYIREIADDGRNDWMEKRNEEGECIGWQLNGEHVQRSKLRVDARKWLASKESSKYGDRMELEHTGSGGGPIEHKVTRDMSPEEAQAAYLEFIRGGSQATADKRKAG